MFAGPLGRSTFTPPKSSFDSPLYGLVSLRRSHRCVFVARTPTSAAATLMSTHGPLTERASDIEHSGKPPAPATARIPAWQGRGAVRHKSHSARRGRTWTVRAQRLCRDVVPRLWAARKQVSVRVPTRQVWGPAPRKAWLTPNRPFQPGSPPLLPALQPHTPRRCTRGTKSRLSG